MRTAFRTVDVKSSLARVAIGCKKQGAVVKIGEDLIRRCVQTRKRLWIGPSTARALRHEQIEIPCWLQCT